MSKELENLSFNALKIMQLIDRNEDTVTVISKPKENRITKSNRVAPESKKTNYLEPKSQLEIFQSSMKLLFIYGQSIALIPVQGITDTKTTNIRFTICSWRFLYSILIGICQSITLAFCLYWLGKNSISIRTLGYLSFICATCAITLLFIQTSYRWPQLMRDVTQSGLDEYVDPSIKRKCYVITVFIVVLSVVEHFLSILHRVEHVVQCRESNTYEEFLLIQFPWYFELDVPRSVPLGVIFQVINIISSMAWNYLDLFIVCMSIYLASVLKKVNVKVIAASQKHYLPSAHWRLLREDYTKATRLVRSFDNAISGLVLTSFASNLFFICLQIFNILAHGVSLHRNKYACPRQMTNGILSGYEYTIYLIVSVAFLIAKTLTVSLVGASVNTASLVPAQALYSVPSSAYCDEVARFITQVNEDKIALSGLQFFYVTKELVLSVAGTIVTYELVLLQFSSNDLQ